MPVRRTLWLLFSIFIVYGGTIPFRFDDHAGAALERLRDLSLNPFISPDTGRRLSIPDVVQNILLYLPFGALGFLAGGGSRAWRRIGIVTLWGIALSGLVESLQLLTRDRVSSTGDLMANGAGAFLGAAGAWQLRGLARAGLGRLREEGLAGVAELRPLGIATTALLVAAWQPFDVTLEVGTVISKTRALQADIWQFTGLRDEGTLVMAFALFAMTFASYLSALGERHAGRKAAVIGVGLAVLLEMSQVFIGSRMPGLWDALVAAFGIAMGTAIWAMAERIVWPRFWLTVLVVATAGSAAIQMLSPFHLSDTYRSFGWFPFLGYYTRTTFDTLSHVIELILIYFPLGFGLSWLYGSSRRAWWTGAALTLAIAIPIEYGQGWIVGRYPDATDVAIGLIGVWAGIHTYNGRRA